MSIPILKNLDFLYPANKLSQQQCSGSAEHSNVILLLRTVENGPTLLQYLNEGKSIKKLHQKTEQKIEPNKKIVELYLRGFEHHDILHCKYETHGNHCNQVYSYSTVFLKFDCCSKCSEITVNLKYTSTLYCVWQILVHGTVNHCNSVLQFLLVSSL